MKLVGGDGVQSMRNGVRCDKSQETASRCIEKNPSGLFLTREERRMILMT